MESSIFFRCFFSVEEQEIPEKTSGKWEEYVYVVDDFSFKSLAATDIMQTNKHKLQKATFIFSKELIWIDKKTTVLFT